MVDRNTIEIEIESILISYSPTYFSKEKLKDILTYCKKYKMGFPKECEFKNEWSKLGVKPRKDNNEENNH